MGYCLKDYIASIIVTTYNEEETIKALLAGLVAQTVKAAEIIICDAKSSDKTPAIVNEFKQTSVIPIRLISKKGNRSVGRNAAITAAKSEIIAVTDAGCIPNKNWLEELLKKYDETHAPIVAGYYNGLPENAFQEAVVPYVLVMPDQVNPETFLPATRSMLLEKKVWEQLGGFNEELSHNEDYAFAQKIRQHGFKIAFAKNAMVGWVPRSTVRDFSIMIQRFAQGDIEAKIIRPKVVLLFSRYLVMLFFLLYLLSISAVLAWIVIILSAIVYSVWAVFKNEKYLVRGWYWLPVLQYVADFSVMKGSVQGLLYHQKKQFQAS